MDETLLHLSEHIISVASQVTIGRAYLKFLGDFSPQGLTDVQILNFFKTCLSINMVSTIQYQPGKGELEKVYLRRDSNDFENTIVQPAILRAATKIPEWFRGSHKDYRDLLIRYSSMGGLLHPEMLTLSAEQQMKIEKQRQEATHRGEYREQKYFGATSPEGVPDWMPDSGEAPQRVAVKEELTQDETDLVSLQKDLVRLIKSRDYLTRSLRDKFNRSREWFNQRWSEIRIADPCLGDFLSFLHIYSQNPDNSIRHYVNLSGRLKDPEVMALWIEENFKMANILVAGQITTDGKEILYQFILAHRPDSNQESIEQFRLFRNLNKKGYNALKFDLGPFIKLLTEEDLTLAQEFFDGLKNNEAGSFVSFLADMVTERMKEVNLETADLALQKGTDEYREFLKKFLRQNWQTLYLEFERILFPIQHPYQQTPPAPAKSEPENLSYEFESEITTIEKGHLDGWKVFYTTDETSENKSLVEIAGNTLDERGVNLQRLLNKLGTSSSIKFSSIINALDWKIIVPKEIEQLTPKILVKSEWWKKIKRQNVRILYQLFPDIKAVIFFVYQKKAWSYDLPTA